MNSDSRSSWGRFVPVVMAIGLVCVMPRHSAAAQSAVTGQVVDTSGAPVPGAAVRAGNGSETRQAQTGDDGRFTFDGAVDLLTVEAAGFATATHEAPASGTDIRIVLHPAPLVDAVTVTASRGATRLESVGTTVVTSAELLNSPGGMVDDVLRNTPGFSLFRRSSSRVANPTTQGVTLRGLSGSGASRTLVLADGVPLNDPFGSWVYWNRVPQAAIDRVEVVRGATGDLYGADALGGVVQLLTFSSQRPRLRATVDGGSHGTGRVSLFGAGRTQGGLTGSVSGEWLETDGVYVVGSEARGVVDTRAGSDYRTGYGTIGYANDRWHATGRANVYTEERANGTPVEVNDTDWRQFGGEIGGTSAGSVWSAQLAGGTQSYYQTFALTAADRATQRLLRDQNIDSTFTTFGGQWLKAFGRTTVLAGGDGHYTDGNMREVAYTATGAPLAPVLVGGVEKAGSIYGRVIQTPSDRVTVAFGARGDFWRSDPTSQSLPGKSVNFFSPRGSVTVRVNDAVSVQGSVYRAYRTPTLNELHRGFRVGNTQTNPNPLLEPERLTGLEGGILWSRPGMSARATAFFNQLDEAIANVTISSTPTLITRERQNADGARSTGLELEGDFRPTSRLTLSALASFTSSHFRNVTSQPALEGNRIPQVPVYQLGGGATYVTPYDITTSAQLRIFGSQYDDDLNVFELDGYAVVDLYAGRTIARGFNGFIAVENLFDEEFDAGRTPIRTIGWPRTVRVGLRVFLP